MSTKTSIKRIAAVAAVALTLGGFSAVSAHAATSASIAVNANSITVVDTTSAVNGSAYGVFEVSPTDTAGVAHALYSGESLTATVTGKPTRADGVTTAATDITLGWAANFVPSTGASSADIETSKVVTSTTNLGSGSTFDLNAVAAQRGGTASSTAAPAYALKVAAAAAAAVDAGGYTITINLLDTNGNVLSQQIVKYTVVSSKANSGAVISGSFTGPLQAGVAIGSTSTSKATVTLRDANGGLIREGANGAATPSVSMVDSAKTSVGSITLADDGTTVAAVDTAALDGVFSQAGTISASAAAGTATETLRYGTASATATASINQAIVANSAATSVSVSATGLSVLSVAPAATSTASTWYVPLSTTSATVKFKGATAGNAYTYSVAYTGVAAGDQTPLASTPTVVYADASGAIALPVTDANPIDGATAVVTVAGFYTAPAAVTIAWVKSKAATVSVSMDGAAVALKSTNTFTATVTDNFGAVVSGVVLQPSVAGSNADVTGRPTVITAADGTASISLTDALAVAAGTDTVTFAQQTSSGVSSTIAGSATITYAATAPVNSSLATYYIITNYSAATKAAITTATPTTGVYADSAGTKFQIQINKNHSIAQTVADTTVTASVASGDLWTLRVVGTAAGVPVTAAVSTGAYVLNGSNLEKTSRTRYTAASTYDTTFVIGTTVAGTNTVTVTSGTVSTTVNFYAKNTTTDARFVTLTADAAALAGATANGAAIPMTASVTDRYGNPVSGVALNISASGVGVISGGATNTTWTTDSTGKFTFQGTSLTATGGAAAYQVTITTSGTDASNLAGKAGSSASTVDSTVAAGVSSVTVPVTYAVGGGQAQTAIDAAQAAVDAANEATDAANAATDAANNAMDSADAAQQAALDAGDKADAALAAVTDLATKVSAIASQIASLSALVKKIAAKVKA